MSIRNFLEVLSQGVLAGKLLVGRLGVVSHSPKRPAQSS